MDRNSRSGTVKIVGTVGFVASLIAIVAFVSGKESIPEWMAGGRAAHPFADPAAPERVRDVSGTWRGVMTQPDHSLWQRYEYELFLTQDGNNIEGSSTVTMAHTSYSGTWRVRGMVSGTKVRFEDVTLTESNVSGDPSWCQKAVELDLPGDGTMRGPWRADGCGAGEIWLVRQ